MYTTQNNGQRGGKGRYRQMYTTQNNRQRERYLDREEEEVGTDRCTQHRTIEREIVRQGGEGGGGGGRYRQMYTTQNNR